LRGEARKVSRKRKRRLLTAAATTGALATGGAVSLGKLSREEPLAVRKELDRQIDKTTAYLRHALPKQLARKAEEARLETARKAEEARRAEEADKVSRKRKRRVLTAAATTGALATGGAAFGKLSREEPLAVRKELVRKELDRHFNKTTEYLRHALPKQLARKAEGFRLESARKAEEARLAEEARKAEEARLAEEARKAEVSRKREQWVHNAVGATGALATVGAMRKVFPGGGAAVPPPPDGPLAIIRRALQPRAAAPPPPDGPVAKILRALPVPR